ncbi:MAG: tRNA (cytidine(56)-2'-O)-methyltransferase [Candidatus Aenigmarchaeota archaeon]|nr:tRNA (cytidine(56)-2'-O)-methyltransferase [Candidatus Aenigmarchaeota archaeon]
MKVAVLRLGHRISRDKRISTHVALVARALGAYKILYSGEKDSGMEESVNNVVRQWGGKFRISYQKSWRHFLKTRKGRIVHLTVYGMPVQDMVNKIKREKKDILVIVGGEKVPWEIYELADYNISVTSQPHSEIAALSIFLDRFFGGQELKKTFPGGSIVVVPQEKGKKIVER